METLARPRALVDSPHYLRQRRAALHSLELRSIDSPIVDLIADFATLSHCFTLQSCYGHFLCSPVQAPNTLERVPVGHAGSVRYRIAYIAVCIANDPSGRSLLESLRQVPRIDPDYVQFGSADWFWKRWPNSYALQVGPRRYKGSDEAVLQVAEALRVQSTRDAFFEELRSVVIREVGERPAGSKKLLPPVSRR
jgi:hypothetical protein